jgi:hypothetical protein
MKLFGNIARWILTYPLFILIGGIMVFINPIRLIMSESFSLVYGGDNKWIGIDAGAYSQYFIVLWKESVSTLFGLFAVLAIAPKNYKVQTIWVFVAIAAVWQIFLIVQTYYLHNDSFFRFAVTYLIANVLAFFIFIFNSFTEEIIREGTTFP